MRRFCILFVIVVALGAGGARRGAAQDRELLQNPDFNTDANGDGLPDGWSTSKAQIRWHEKAYMGKDYEIISQPGAYVLATQDIKLQKGRRYTITITCKAEDGGIAGALIVHGTDRPHQEMPLLWNVFPSDKYEEYVATFIAPNPVARLYIYNIARTHGTVYYDRVSLREGSPDHPIVNQISFRPIDRPLGAPPETLHIPWATPLAGGPIKSLVTQRTMRSLRQVIELAERIDLDYDVLDTGYDGVELESETSRRVTQRLKDDSYQVYVVASRVPDTMVKEIRQHVEAGAGLVVVEGFGQASKFLPLSQFKAVNDAHYLRSGIPWALLPEKLLQSVEIGDLGKGRVVCLVFPMDVGRVWGLLPTENSLDTWRSRQCEYWEWWESLLAKALLWAARRDGTDHLQETAVTPDDVTIKADHAPPNARLRVIVRSSREIRFAAPLVREPAQLLPVQADGTARIKIPATMPDGAVIVDAMLLDGTGAVVDWGSFTTVRPQAVRVTSLQTDRDWYHSADTVQLKLGLNAATAVAGTIDARLVDAFGRVVDADSVRQAIPAGESSLPVRLRLRDPITVAHKAFVRILVDGREQDSRWVPVLVPEVGPQEAAADFIATTWAPGMEHPAILARYADRTRELGLNSEFAGDPYLIVEHGMPSGGYIGGNGAFRQGSKSPNGVRPKCLSDPAVVSAYTAHAVEMAQSQAPYGLFAVGITDEAFLTNRQQVDEVCFSSFCQARYRKWLQQRYAGLDALNREWGTAYRSWEQVRGARSAEVRGKTDFAPFVDFRTFMTDVWVDACRTIAAAYHKVAPQTPVGHTNTFGATPFDGNDYWKLATQVGFGWGQEYSEAIKGTAQKAIFDLWRSFADTPEARQARTTPDQPFFNYGWIGYDHSVEAVHYEPWWLALHGSRGVSYYATNSLDPAHGTSWALVYPTLSYTPYSLAVQETLRDLRAGCGKLFMEYTRERPSIALLWSHPSMLVSWCEAKWDEPVPCNTDGTGSYETYFKAAFDFRQHVNELQEDYQYLAPEQIANSTALSGYRLLYLPFTVAASEALVDKLESYLQSGGVLVGDLRCLQTDEHGKPFADSAALRRLFGVERVDVRIDYGATKVNFGRAAEGIDLTGKQMDVFGRENLRLAGGAALAKHDSGEPAVIVLRHCKGLSIYFNFVLPEYDITARELIRQILARAGIARTVTVESLKGDTPPRCYERDTFSRGPITVHAFIRDHRRCTDSDPVRIRFGKRADVYDLRAGKYLGEVDSVKATVAPGDTVLYALLPYRVTQISVQAPSSVQRGKRLSVRAEVVPSRGAAGDHILHVEFVDPSGTVRACYTRNVSAPGGKATITTPLALNEAVGAWQVRVRDVLTGTAGTSAFNVVQ